MNPLVRAFGNDRLGRLRAMGEKAETGRERGQGAAAPLPVPTDPARKVSVCWFRSIRDNEPKVLELGFDELAARLAKIHLLKGTCRTPDKCGDECLGKCLCPGLTGATFRGKRSKANVEALHFLCLDFDNGGTEPLGYDEARDLLARAGLRFVLHTTLSHRDDRPKFRALVALEEPLPAALYEKAMGRLLARLIEAGISRDRMLASLDETLLKGSHVHQMYLIPAHREGRRAPLFVDGREGKPFALPMAAMERELQAEKEAERRRLEEARAARQGLPNSLPEGLIEEVRRRSDLVEIVGQYTPLKKAGAEWTGLCPFHEEKTPSFGVNPVKGLYHCFGCGAGGDVFEFLEKKTGRGFMDVLRDLAARGGVSLPEVPRSLFVRRTGGNVIELHRTDGEERPNRILEHRQTEMANAELFVEEYGHELRYCHPWSKWLAWDGKRWRLDDTGEAVKRAKSSAERMYGDAQRCLEEGAEADLKPVLKWVRSSQQAARIKATMYLAQSEAGMAVLPDQLDADHWALNVANGVLDLKTGQLRPHSRNDLVTKLVPSVYDPAAKCPTWEKFLARVMGGNAAVIAYLQRVVGYSLTGSTREQCFFFLHGTGANGKSTFLDVVRDLMGDYGQHMPTEALLTKSYASSGPTPEIARLKGVRYATAVEADAGRRLAEALIKQMTGGEPLAARFNRADTFEFFPTHKLFLAANHKPEIRGTDHAIWRRVHTIPFEVTIPEGERDPNLTGKLKGELPGILAWAVKGCLEWQAKGLQIPEAVRLATQEYRTEMDLLGDFLEQVCLVSVSVRVKTADLYGAYERWCLEERREVVKHRAFSLRLKERGFKTSHTRNGNWWLGVALRE